MGERGALEPDRGGVLSDLAVWLAATFGGAPAHLAPFERALTHGSHAGETYERLEFLGDRVLGLVTAEWLFELSPTSLRGSYPSGSTRWSPAPSARTWRGGWACGRT